MFFSIVTPSFRQLEWLDSCAASIADQEVEREHLVQDAGSPGIEEWARTHPQVKVTVEPDEGMYDAINRGLKRTKGDICSYLNCDEQYLPGTLRKVGDFFVQHPEVDVIFGDAILADKDLRPLSYRRTVTPLRWHTLLRPLGILTCSTFFRRKIVDDGALFDPSWKIIGDKAWVLDLLDRGYGIAALNEPLAVFAFTGANLSHLRSVAKERDRWEKDISPQYRMLRPLARLHHVWRKWRAGAYMKHRGDLSYYTRENLGERKMFAGLRLGHSWPAQKM